MRNKKQLYLTISIILFVAIFMLILCYTKKDQLAFQHYVRQFTRTQLSSNALDLHYTIKDPSAYDIYVSEMLPIYQPEDALNSYQQFADELERLSAIDVSGLSSEDAFTYYILSDYLNENLELEKFPYYTEPLTPNSGVHTTLPILLAEYAFYSKEDIDTYLDILSLVPAYLDSIALYEEERAAKGFFMNSIALDKVVTACEEFVTYKNLSEHLLASSFRERLEALSTRGIHLSEEEIDTYIQRNQAILEKDVFPAYTTLSSKLTDLSLYCNDNYSGLCSYTDGKEYYCALIKRNTGSYRSIQNIKEMLFADFEESYTNLISLLSSNPQLLEMNCFDDFSSTFPLKNAEDMLTHLQSSIEADFPALEASTNVQVKTVSENLQDYCSPAFYLTVPIDEYDNNVIYLNNKNALTGLDLYTTLAHEGFPGHLYQTVFFYDSNASNDTIVSDYSALLRNILYFGGYTEGYALYVEWLSYDYAVKLCSDANVSDAQIICEALKYEWQMQISLYCLLDIAIHYDGVTYEQVKALLNKFGIVDEASAKTVYQYLLEEPTTYLKYYLGYLEIKSLKNLAKGIWGNNYSDLAFHTFLLESGPCSFKRLENKLLEEE